MNIKEGINALHAKSLEAMAKFKNLPSDNIKRNLLEMIQSQVARVEIATRVHARFIDEHRNEFYSYFGDDNSMVQNYFYGHTKDVVDNIATTIFFQTELVFRAIYANNKAQKIGEEGNFHKIIAHIFSDTENNWKKNESKLTILLWKLRNINHGGGIYFDGNKEPELEYLGKKYKFEYGKIPNFQPNELFPFFIDFIDAIVFAFENEPSLSTDIPHPFYAAK